MKNMNKSETKAKRWLLKQGYKEGDIVFQRKGIDFLCSDGKKYEVKRLYGHSIWFHQGQMERTKNEKGSEVLVMCDGEEAPISIINTEQLKENAIIDGIKIVIANTVNTEGKKTVSFNIKVVEIIENYRRGQKRIPSFSEAVNELIITLNLDSGTRIRIEQYAKDCKIEMSQAYADIIKVGLEIVAQNK